MAAKCNHRRAARHIAPLGLAVTTTLAWAFACLLCIFHPVRVFKPDLHPALQSLLRRSLSTIRPWGSEQDVHRVHPVASAG